MNKQNKQTWIQGAKLDVAGAQDLTALHLSVLGGHIDVVRYENKNKRNEWKQTNKNEKWQTWNMNDQQHKHEYAIKNKAHTWALKLEQITNKTNMITTNKHEHEWTNIRLLLEYGLNIDYQNKERDTSLHLACRSNFVGKKNKQTNKHKTNMHKWNMNEYKTNINMNEYKTNTMK